MKALFRQYLRDLIQVAAHGDAREESFYATLANTLKNSRLGDKHTVALPNGKKCAKPCTCDSAHVFECILGNLFAYFLASSQPAKPGSFPPT